MAETPEPLGVQKCYIPHWKAQTFICLEPEVQGRGSTSTMCHALLKKVILHYTSVAVLFDLNIAECVDKSI